MDLKFESQTFEKGILPFFLKDKSFFLKVGIYLRTHDFSKKSYFLDEKLQFLLNYFCAFHQSYKHLPNQEEALSAAEKKFVKNELYLNAVKKCIEDVYTKELKLDETYAKEEIVDFVRTARALEATLANELDIQNGNFSSLSKRLQDAVNINLDKDLGISLADSRSTMELIQSVEENSGLTFGSATLDKVLGSPRAGEITVFCGTPGIGKTIWLGNIAVENMKKGKKGIFFSLEVDKKRLSTRLYASIIGIPIRDLVSLKTNDQFYEELKSGYEAFSKNGDIRIKNYPANSACANDFMNCLNDLYTTEGFKPDFIIVDYILITATNNSRGGDSENSYKYYKTVTEELRNLAIECGCPLFTAAQLNRSAQADDGNGTKHLVTAKDLSESRGILDTCDYCLIINQDAKEKKQGESDGVASQRLLVAKNRNGSDGAEINFTLNYNTMTIREGRKGITRL